MGLKLLNSSSSFENHTINKNELPNPNPSNYTIIHNRVVRGYLVIAIKYHDCINYEGKKIMLYDCTLDDLKNQKLIDPHFSDNKDYFSPIARFEPTIKGWDNACKLANILEK